MPYLLGMDVATIGAKALLIDEKGKVVAGVTKEYPLSTPCRLWSEQDPTDDLAPFTVPLASVSRGYGPGPFRLHPRFPCHTHGSPSRLQRLWDPIDCRLPGGGCAALP